MCIFLLMQNNGVLLHNYCEKRGSHFPTYHLGCLLSAYTHSITLQTTTHVSLIHFIYLLNMIHTRYIHLSNMIRLPSQVHPQTGPWGMRMGTRPYILFRDSSFGC